MNSHLKLYIGMPNPDGIEEFLYLDLVVPNREVTLWTSSKELNNCSGEDFLDILTTAISEASIYVKNLNLRVNIDAETIAEIAEDFTERESRELSGLLKEIRKE